MTAPPGWSEPFQTPEFDEYTFIIKGKKQITIDNDDIVLSPGESIKVLRGNRLKYSNPFTEPCEYISICIPAFTLDTVNRDNA